MSRIIYLLLSLVLCFLLFFIVNDKSESFFHFLGISILFFLWLLASLLNFIAWRKIWRSNKKVSYFIAMLLPLLTLSIVVLAAYKTNKKVNKPYYLKANHQRINYYFRVDSTLKVEYIHHLGKNNSFQQYKMYGDTILLDTILPNSGIKSKNYLLKDIDSNNDHFYNKVLCPIINGKIDTIHILYVDSIKITQ